MIFHVLFSFDPIGVLFNFHALMNFPDLWWFSRVFWCIPNFSPYLMTVNDRFGLNVLRVILLLKFYCRSLWCVMERICALVLHRFCMSVKSDCLDIAQVFSFPVGFFFFVYSLLIVLGIRIDIISYKIILLIQVICFVVDCGLGNWRIKRLYVYCASTQSVRYSLSLFLIIVYKNLFPFPFSVFIDVPFTNYISIHWLYINVNI